MVPPRWNHPKMGNGDFRPMHNETFAAAAERWKAEFSAWERGERPSYFDPAENPDDMQFWEWAGPPPHDREYFRPYADSEATWFQLYETVTEGTPRSPPFASKEELAEYLATVGDFWSGEPWGRERADAFLRMGSAPSAMIAGGVLYESKDVPLAMEKERRGPASR